MSDNNRAWVRITPASTKTFKTKVNGEVIKEKVQVARLKLNAHARTLDGMESPRGLVDHVRGIYTTPAGVAKLGRGVSSAHIGKEQD